MNKQSDVGHKVSDIALVTLLGMLSTVCYLLITLALSNVAMFIFELPDLLIGNQTTTTMYLQQMGYLVFACILWIVPSQIYARFLKVDELS